MLRGTEKTQQRRRSSMQEGDMGKVPIWSKVTDEELGNIIAVEAENLGTKQEKVQNK